jgi:hypothetical protein
MGNGLCDGIVVIKADTLYDIPNEMFSEWLEA